MYRLLAVLFLASCATTQPTNEYKQAENTVGIIWQQNECQTYTSVNGVDMYVSKYRKEPLVRALIKVNHQLSEEPTLKIYGLNDHSFNFTGANGTYSVEIPFSKTHQALMTLDRVFIEVKYKKLNDSFYKKTIVRLNRLPLEILKLNKVCG